MSDKDNYSEAIRELENTLNGYNEKETKKIIMEFLKKHEDEYKSQKGQDEKFDEEYEVYSNSLAGFNDDYIPERYEETEDYDDYEENEEDYGGYEDESEETNDSVSSEGTENMVIPDVLKRRDSINKSQKRKKVYDNEYFDGNSKDKKSGRRTEKKSGGSGTAPIIAKISCVMVAILAVVVIFLFNRLNDADAKLAKLSLGESQTQEYESTIEDLRSQLKNKEAHIENLDSQIEAYKRAFEDVGVDDETSSDTSEKKSSNNDSKTSNTSSGSSNKNKTYTVVKGDNLSKISKRNYGSEKYVDIIKEANNIKSDVLTVGDTLIIPEI